MVFCGVGNAYTLGRSEKIEVVKTSNTVSSVPDSLVRNLRVPSIVLHRPKFLSKRFTNETLLN